MMTSTPLAKPQLLPHEGVRFHLCSKSNESNTIPLLDFVEDVGAFLKKENANSVDVVLEELNRLHRNLKTHQSRLLGERMEIERRKPDLEENVAIIKTLQGRCSESSPTETNVRFMAADGVWSDAIIERKPGETEDKVCLWLGANVMMEYTYAEALELLTTNVEASERTIETKKRDLETVKNQLTMCEVTISRFYNWDVAMKKARGGGAGVKRGG